MHPWQRSVVSNIKRGIYFFLGYFLFRRGIAKDINGSRIRFPFAYSRYYPQGYESDKQQFIENYASGIVLDLGAHIGLYTVLLSRVADEVIAFEPTEFTRKILEQTIALNRCKNVTIRSEGISDNSTTAIFYDTGDRVSNANSLIPLGSPIEIQTITIDDLNKKVDFMKIDIEGAELLALQGASRTLSTLKYMTIEIHPRLLMQVGQEVSEIVDLLSPYNPIYFFEGKEVSTSFVVSHKELFELNVALNGASLK